MDRKPTDVFDRAREWRALDTIWQSGRPELAFVLGRRRAGKSHVLARWARSVDGLYYQATRQTEAEQLAQLTRVVGARFDDAALVHGAAFSSWDQLFAYLKAKADGGPLVLVLDEFPYLASAAAALPSILQRVWDHEWPGTQIKLVLSGSFITAMTALEAADQPLYGRRTRKLNFGPFAVSAARLFMPDYAPLDQLRAYAMFGHLPGNLARVDSRRPLAENVARDLLDPMGPLVDDAEHMLDAFQADARVHYSVLQAIATGQQTWSGIASRVGQSGGSLSRPLGWLEEMRLIRRDVPLTEKSPARSKRALYRVNDPYVAFWHSTIAPLVRNGSIGLVDPDRLWAETIEPRLSEHLGPVFEDVCRDFVRTSERLPFQPMRVGEWWDANGQDQVDIVATDAHGAAFFGECKWGPVGRQHVAELRRRGHQVAHALGARTLHFGVFSARGELDAAVQAEVDAGELLWFDGPTVAAG